MLTHPGTGSPHSMEGTEINVCLLYPRFLLRENEKQKSRCLQIHDSDKVLHQELRQSGIVKAMEWEKIKSEVKKVVPGSLSHA